MDLSINWVQERELHVRTGPEMWYPDIRKRPKKWNSSIEKDLKSGFIHDLGAGEYYITNGLKMWHPVS